MAWGVYKTQPGSPITPVHVVPLNDLVEHLVDWDGECVCGPRCEPVERLDGSMGWEYVHHSADNREAGERARAEKENAEASKDWPFDIPCPGRD